MAPDVSSLVAERARRFGPLPFDEVVDLALYHAEHGFYASARGAGRERDFVTSPELGRLFGAVVAHALDEWWAELRRPDPFVVTEAGAGAGTLAAAVLAAAPECAGALRYVMVEQSARLRAEQAVRLSLEPASFVLGPSGSDDSDPGSRPQVGSGPLLTALSELPTGPFEGVVLANELLDNVPFALLHHTEGVWHEVRVGLDLGEVLVPAAPALAAQAGGLVPDVPDEARIPLQRRAGAWLRAALGCLRRGRVVVVDYADTTPNMARRPWTEWVRTYRAHGRGGHPLADLGRQDVTCEVATDQLARVRPPVGDRTQAEFLTAHGLDALVDAARQAWDAGAASGDLAALAARSRVTEAAALTDPAGLGAFRVLEWQVPEEPPRSGRVQSLR
ncbi:MAG TPA: SAM-dependent methyltransferase [Acidimicrobiales bacterium]|nr:SAM-dependent methyltransferase [Acidimicrobiales bacterium]